jgi:hypothetical protein
MPDLCLFLAVFNAAWLTPPSTRFAMPPPRYCAMPITGRMQAGPLVNIVGIKAGWRRMIVLTQMEMEFPRWSRWDRPKLVIIALPVTAVQ